MPIIVTEMPPNRSLKELLNKKRSNEDVEEWNDTKKLIDIFGIASGMAYLHSHDVIHRNLTPESIFLDDYLFPKIGNFGLLTKIHTIASMTFQTTIGIKGDFSYSSPELLENNEYSKQSDVYSFALLVYEIMTLKIPFKDVNNFNSLYNDVVIDCKRPELDDGIPERYRQLIEICWSHCPEERPSFEEIMSILKNDEGFITKNVDKKAFLEYVQLIEESQIKFYSDNRVVKYDDIINEKNEEKNRKLKQEEEEKNRKLKQEEEKEKKGKKQKTKTNDSSAKSKAKQMQRKTTLMKNEDKRKIGQLETISNYLLNRRFLGYVRKEVIEHLLQKSMSIHSTLASRDHQIKIGELTTDDDFVIVKILNKELFIEKNGKEKIIDKEKIYKYDSELKVINTMNHPNIVKILGFFTGNIESPPSVITCFYSRRIRDIIKTVDDIYLVCFVYEIGHAMRYIHSRKLVHRNLNIDDIFVDSNNHVKLAGFGIPILMSPSDQIKKLEDEKPFCVPQELLNNDEYDEKVDVFSFGMIMEFILLRGKGSFLTRNDIIKGMKAKFPKTLNKLSYSLIKQCLSHLREERKTFNQITHSIKKHNFMLIDGIEKKIPILEKHLQLIINRREKNKK